MSNSTERSLLEISRGSLTDLEQDTLNHYPGKVSGLLKDSLRGGVIALHNILPELYSRGLRMRIVPEGMNITDLPECLELRNYKTKQGKYYYDEVARGIYIPGDKMIVIYEEEILYRKSVNQAYEVLIHEFAHGIWHLYLSTSDKGEVVGFYMQELQNKKPDSNPKMENVDEFFAYSFVYYITPYRRGEILGVKDYSFMGVHFQEVEKERTSTSKEELKGYNINLFKWMERKFKGIIEPELVMGKRESRFDDEIRYAKDPRTGLYSPIIYSGDYNA